MKLWITNKQDVHRVSMCRITRFFTRTAEHFLGMCHGTKWTELSLVLTDHAGISRINQGYLHVADTTDVIAFRYDSIPGETDCLSGEIFVNIAQSVELGPAHGGCSRELALYIAHGCDHLSGEDDHSSAGYVRMRQRELRWLRSAASDGLLRLPMLPGTGTP